MVLTFCFYRAIFVIKPQQEVSWQTSNWAETVQRKLDKERAETARLATRVADCAAVVHLRAIVKNIEDKGDKKI